MSSSNGVMMATPPIPDAAQNGTSREGTSSRRARALGPVLCLAGASLGALGLLGWLTEVPALTTVIPGRPAMMPNTGATLVLLGVAAALRWRRHSSLVSRGLSWVAAIAVLVIGVGTLLEYTLDISLGLDQLVLPSRAGPHPGRPSPPTALGLALLAVAILLFDSRPTARVRPSEVLAISTAIIGYTALLAHVFGAARLYWVAGSPFIGVGVHSALALLLIAVGMLLERRDGGVMRVVSSPGPGGMQLRRLLPAAILAPIALGFVAVRVLPWVGIEQLPVLAAVLAVAVTVTSSVLLTVSALPLNRTHEQLRQSQERFELALRGANLGAWDWNVQTGEVIFNRRWAEMRGYLLEDVRPHVDSWTSGVHPDDWPMIQRTLDEYFAERIPEYEAEHRVRTKSGEWIWILDRGRVFSRDLEGRPLRMVGTELEITERKRIEAALLRSEATFSGILSVSADAIISIDEDQRITMFNHGAEKVFGYTRAEVLGAPLDILIPSRLRALHREHVKKFAASSATSRRMGERGAVIIGLRKDGEEFPADAAISKLDVGGELLLTVALRDVTEETRIQAEERFLTEVGTVLASSLDYDDTLRSVAHLAVQHVADVCIVDVAGDDSDARRLTVAARDPSRAWACEVLMRMPLDPRRTLLERGGLATGRPLLMQDPSPELLASLATTDEQRAAILSLEPRSLILAPLVTSAKILGGLALLSSPPSPPVGPTDVRLAELLAHRAALSIETAWSYHVAQRAIQARDEVLGVVAHDLRNPLGSILMQLALLRRSKESLEYGWGKAADVIERSANRMNRLIQDLLDVTRMEAGRLTIEPAPTAAGPIVTDSVEVQRPLAAQASIELLVDVERELPDICADRDRLLQVFENLIGNALKFSGAGDRIVVGAAPRHGEVLFWVADDGAGIAAEDLPHLFDRFWQGQRAGRHHGAGLGLPIVKGIIEAHGGRVWVDSTLGRGSTFFFTLPMAPGAQESAVPSEGI